MLSALSQNARSTGNPLWGLGGPHNATAYNQQPRSTSFFSDKGGSGMSLSEVAKLRSQPSELAVGLYSSNGHDRYEAITEIFANQ
ncbi:hypothetical protein Bca4012_066787 [Brassica carinata]